MSSANALDESDSLISNPYYLLSSDNVPLSAIQKYNLTSLQILFSGAAPLGAELVSAVMKRLKGIGADVTITQGVLTNFRLPRGMLRLIFARRLWSYRNLTNGICPPCSRCQCTCWVDRGTTPKLGGQIGGRRRGRGEYTVPCARP